jgi:hypothetical protein
MLMVWITLPMAPCLHQLAGIDRGLHFQPLAVHDGVDALGLGDGLAHLGQLLQRGDPGLVGSGSPCRAAWRGRPAARVDWDLRTEHQLNGRIVQDLVLRRNHLDVGKALLEGCELVGSPAQTATISPPPR